MSEQEFASRLLKVLEVSRVLCQVRDSEKLVELEKLVSTLKESVALSQETAGSIESPDMGAVSLFAGRVAHDFNNWLTAIIGYSQMALARIGSDSPVKRELEQIERAGTRAAGVTQKLLAFSRKQVLHPTAVGLNDVIADLSRHIASLAGTTIQVIVELDPGLGQVKADRHQLEQMIRDVVANAKDAMQDGGKLSIRTSNEERADMGTCALLVISDTGKGIEPDVLPRIFEPFFTTKLRSERSGLGLATVYGFVRQSGGDIAVESIVGQGTKFKVYLPQVRGAVAESETAAGVAAGTQTILVVDDEDSARGLVREVLKRRGYGVLEARNGIEALAICERHHGKIDLMFTDVNMPKMNGNRLARDLGNIRPDTKVLYSSGGFGSGTDANGGMGPTLAKPFTPDQLLSKVEEVLTGKCGSVAGTRL
jgi:signal transduction histidine kinase/CheY-like chemotaxis protein